MKNTIVRGRPKPRISHQKVARLYHPLEGNPFQSRAAMLSNWDGVVDDSVSFNEVIRQMGKLHDRKVEQARAAGTLPRRATGR